MSDRITVYPKINNNLITNPGIGFIAAPALMGNCDVVCDNNGKQVGKYKFTEDSRTWNHPDSKVYYCGVSWKDLEPEEGNYRWKVLEDKLEAAKSMSCTAIVRCAPYALSEEEDIPKWFRARYPEEPEFPFWRIDPNTS
ncbi:MAG: beta-galactosidase, partial [Mobilitalea sp.]